MYFVLLKNKQVVKIMSSGDSDITLIPNILSSAECDEVKTVESVEDVKNILNGGVPDVIDTFTKIAESIAEKFRS